MYNKKKESLAETHPELLKEWDFEKNKALGLDPYTVEIGSTKKAWWKCNKGHSYYMIINKKNDKVNYGCPCCSGYQVVTGETDFATTHSKLLKYWNYEKNNKLNILPTEVKAGSSKKVWWTCEHGHDEFATILSKTRVKEYNCSECKRIKRESKMKASKVTSKARNLTTTAPKLLKLWDYEENDKLGIKPNEVNSRTEKEISKLNWKCPKCNHKWKATFNAMKNNSDCPNCKKNAKALKGINDFGTLFPYLLKEWDEKKNKGMIASQMAVGNTTPVWWKCSKGHDELSTIAERVKNGCITCKSEKK